MATVGIDTYVSEADALAYTTLMGLEPIGDPTVMLPRATRALDDIYWARYISVRVSISQPLAWPRYGIEPDFPSNLADATTEMALLLQSGVNVFAPPAPAVLEERTKVDVIEQELKFAQPYTLSQGTLHRVNMLLGPLLSGDVSTGDIGSMRLVRG